MKQSATKTDRSIEAKLSVATSTKHQANQKEER
jgi:hypothetical protein